MLETLEVKHLQKMKEFVFVQKMIESIPATQEIIRAAVLREMRDWFLSLRESTNLLGKEALSLEIKNREVQLEKYTEDENNLDEARVETNDQELIIDTTTIIDFTPLYQCIHIHDFLGKGNILKVIYHNNLSEARVIMHERYFFFFLLFFFFFFFFSFFSSFFLFSKIAAYL